MIFGIADIKWFMGIGRKDSTLPYTTKDPLNWGFFICPFYSRHCQLILHQKKDGTNHHPSMCKDYGGLSFFASAPFGRFLFQ